MTRSQNQCPVCGTPYPFNLERSYSCSHCNVPLPSRDLDPSKHLNSVYRWANHIWKYYVEQNPKFTSSKKHRDPVFEQEITESQISTSVSITSSTSEGISSVEVSEKQHLILEWVEQFNCEPEAFAKNAIEVSTAEETLGDQRLVKGKQQVILEKKSGHYWAITSSEDCTYWYLVPKQKFKFNPYSLESTRLCFDLKQNDSVDYFDYKVLMPAIISSIDQDKWELVNRGELEFNLKK